MRADKRSTVRLPHRWPEHAFGSVFSKPLRNGVYKPKQFHGRGQKIINMGELFAHEFIGDQGMGRVELSVRERDQALVRDGDLLFARRSYVLEGSGKCSLVVSPPEDTTFESSIIRARLNTKVALPRFYYYLFRSSYGRGLMASIATRTAVSGIRGGDLAQLRVPLPPLEVQRGVASVLSPYDDLVENNTRRITILEEMARSLYREWFVNFRFPGHEKVKLVKSPLGPIPEGWEAKKLGDVVELAYGKALKADDRRDGPFPVYGSSGIVGFHSERLVDGPGIIVGRKGNVGSVFWSDEPFYPIDTAFFVKTKVALRYTFFNLQHQTFINSDAAVPGLNRSQAYGLPFVVPASFVLGSFEQLCKPLFDLAKVLAKKNANVRSTGDFLLPKLISGEIEVSQPSGEPLEATA